MSMTGKVFVILLAVLLVAVVVELFAEQGKEEPDFSIRKSEAQTVLYTVYRGPYESVGKPIGELFTLAAQKKIIPRGSVSLVYLNNPHQTIRDNPAQHCITEIRIPVNEEAMQQTGTLGQMTDVKMLRPVEVAVMKKQPGSKDYEAIFSKLYGQIAKAGYRPVDNAVETFSGNTASGDYSRMTSEILVPVVKLDSGNN
jgi:DNA gyrase inhibitor GyrI